ncbi:MAG: hypothetical protein M3388_13925 [Acidobacteriota bacterium]|nr:hypothetical protein [Acidobacteriota bacterium]
MAKKSNSRKTVQEQIPIAKQPPTTTAELPTQSEVSLQEQTFLQKIWKLSESNLFWGGGCGVIIVTFGTLLTTTAITFSFVLLVVGWMMITISIWRHKFFERKSNKAQAFGNISISLPIGVILFGMWILLRPIPTTLLNMERVIEENPSQTSPAENSITDFKVTMDTDRIVEVEVWYFYKGDIGTENILLYPYPRSSSGENLNYKIDTAPAEVIVTNTKAVAKMELSYTPLSEGAIEKTSQIEFCIMSSEKGLLHCRTFLYEKTWK